MISSYKGYFKLIYGVMFIYLCTLILIYTAHGSIENIEEFICIALTVIVLYFSELELVKHIIYHNRTNPKDKIVRIFLPNVQITRKEIFLLVVFYIIIITYILFFMNSFILVGVLYLNNFLIKGRDRLFLYGDTKQDRLFIDRIIYLNPIFKKSSNFIFKILRNKINKKAVTRKLIIAIILLIIPIIGIVVGEINNIKSMYNIAILLFVVLLLMILRYKMLLDGLTAIENFNSREMSIKYNKVIQDN